MSTSNDFFQRLYRRPKSLLFAAGVVIVSLVLYASPNHALDYNAILDRAAYFGSKPESAESTKRRAISDRISELEAQFGKRFFQKSVAYSGTNTRLHVVLRRVLSGRPFKVGYLGGSVSAGANVAGDSVHALWPNQLLRVLNETLPHPDNEVAGIALGGTGSEYYAWCGLELLNDDAEIILLEHSVNNDPALTSDYWPYDSEVRGMLARPTRPAVMGLEFFQLWGSIAQPAGMVANHIFRYYDAPYLTLKGPLQAELIAHPNRLVDFFGVEGINMETDTFHYNWGHVNSRGHWAMAALIAHHVFSQALIVLDEGPYDPLSETRHPMDRYIPGDEALAGERPQEEFFEVVNSIDAWKDETMWGQELVYEDIPRLGILDSWNFDKAARFPEPHCLGVTDPKRPFVFENVAFGQKKDGTVTEGGGWEIWKAPLSRLEKWYLRSDSLGAIVRMKVTIIGEGDVQIDFLRSETYGLGNARCWWESDVGTTYFLQGYRPGPFNTGGTILVAKGLPHGDHWLYCETIEGADFRIIAIQTR